MSLVPADGLYRRRIFHSGRHASRRMMAMRLAAVVAGSGVFLSPTLHTTVPASRLTLASPGAATEGDAIAAVLPEQPVAKREPAPPPLPEPKPAEDAAPPAMASNSTASPTADAPAPTPAPIPAANAAVVTVASTPPVAAQPSPPATPPAARRTRQPQTFMELTYYSDRASARRGAIRLRRMWGHALAGMPLQVMPAQARGKTIWRVVAGPTASREHAERFCAVVHRAGRTCSVAVI